MPRILVGVVCAAILAACPLVTPGAAHAADQTAIVSLNVNADGLSVPFATTRPFTRTATVVAATVTGGIHVRWTNAGRLYTVDVPTTDLAPLRRGLVTNVEGQSNTHVGLEYQLEDVAFDADHGVVQVLDIAADPSGEITRFDVVFQSSVLTSQDAGFGEVRMNEPETLAGLSPTMNVIEWPTMSLHQHAVTATESFENTTVGPLAVGAATIADGSTGDYSIVRDGCSDVTLDPGAECSLDVSFSPVQGGPSDAELRLATGIGTVRIPLSGVTPIGTSTLTSSGKEGVDNGTTQTFTGLIALATSGTATTQAPGGHTIRFLSDPEAASVRAQAAKGDTEYGATLTLNGPSSPLALGTHAVPLAAHTSGYGMQYEVREAGCTYPSNMRFTVRAMTLTTDGRPDHALVDFSETCKETGKPTGTLTGHLSFGVRSDITAPKSPGRSRSADTRSRGRSRRRPTPRRRSCVRSRRPAGPHGPAGRSTPARAPPRRCRRWSPAAATSSPRTRSTGRAT